MILRKPCAAPVILAVVVLFHSPALAGKAGSLIGKKVLVKETGQKIGHTDAKGEQVYDSTLSQITYIVLGENGKWIQLREGAVQGWISKDKVVTLDEAVPYYSAKIKDNPLDPSFWHTRAEAYFQKGDFDNAISDMTEAIRLDPSEPASYNIRGDAYSEKNDFDHAIADYTEAIRLQPKSSAGYYNRGRAYVTQSKYDPAITDLTEAIRLEPRDPDGFQTRGYAYERLKDYKKALADYNEALRLDPKEPFNYKAIAWILATCPKAEFRDGKKALTLAKKLNEFNKSKVGGDLDTLAAAYAEVGQFEEAVRWETQALADVNFAKEFGDGARARLKLYREKKAYRDNG